MMAAGVMLAGARAERAMGQNEGAMVAGILSSGSLTFYGHATLGDFTGVTSTLTGEMSGDPALGSVRGWVEAPVTTLLTGNGKRDTDLRKSMESDEYPVIRYELDSLTPIVIGDGADVILHGKFTIHGVTRAVSIPAQLELYPGGARMSGDTPMNLKDYKIGGLTKALGFLKMSEKIEVHYDLSFVTGPMALTSGE